jgi:iron complex outermembrane recepter protein
MNKSFNGPSRFARSTSLSSLGLALMLTLGSGTAFAQEAADDAGDEIVVTGFKGSLDRSAELKKVNSGIVEVVSAEDIGKLPDVSIADSLARLPGVTAQRLEGRDQRLSIRGLGPDLGTTLLNGREQVTVGDNRGVEYDQYPSEFFKNVFVIKSAQANVLPAGIAGTVDLHMLRPLAQKDRIIALQARGQMNGQKSLNPDSPRYGFRGSATYVDKFNDDTLGIAIGVSASHTPSQDERYNAWGFPDDGNAGPAVGNALRLGGAKPYVQSNLLKRYGAVGTVEYEPSDNFHTTIDVLYSKFKETQRLRGIEFPINPGWGAGTAISNPTIVNGFVTGATVTGVHAVQRNDLNQRDATNFSAGWNTVFGVSDKVNLTIDASYSKAKRTDFLLETYSGFGYNTAGPGDTLKITQQPNGIFRIVPTLNYTNTGAGGVGITDPRGWGYNGTTAVVQAGFLNRPSFKDDLKALRASLDGELEMGVVSGWEVGGNISQRKKTSAFKSYFLCPKGAGTNCTVSSGTPTFVPVPEAAKVGSNIALDYLGVPAILTLDPLYLYNNTLNPVFDNRPVSLVRDNSIKETISTGYAMLKIDGDAGGKPLKGSVGVQVVHSKQSSSGSFSRFAGGVVTVVPTTGGESYTNILPSAALSLEIADKTFIKWGASRTMVRARLDQLRINSEFGFDPTRLAVRDPANSAFSSNGGNINLRPYKSDNFDLSLEKYFAKSGYVSVSAYYKSLKDYVNANDSFIFDFSDAVSTLSPADRAGLGTPLGLVSGPTNNGKGDLQGIEGTLSLPFENLSESLSGFGFFGSMSYTDSNIKLRNTKSGNVNAITLPGLSKWVGNAEVYFEKAGFQSKISYRYRSSFLGEVAGLSANPDFRKARSEAILDAQIGYEFQPGSALAGLSVLLQAKNLTDRPFVTYGNNDPRQVIDYQRYGRDYYIGLSYKF